MEDRTAIADVIALHGHLFDAGRLDELDLLFTDDVTYDVSDLGGGVLRGADAVRDAGLALGAANPVAHLVTNVVVTGVDGDRATALSKGVGVMADGTVGAATYDDTLVRTADGWRISTRVVTSSRTPLGGRGAQ